MDKVELVKKCQSGDREALGILYQTYLAPMREVVAYYIHNADIEQDVLHDGFLIAFASIGSLKNGARVGAWLTSIMKNLSLQYLRDYTSHISVAVEDTAIAEDAVGADDGIRELTWDELDKIIGRLPEGYGKVFRLAVLDGLSHKEIAALLGIAPHSSSSQLSHAKAMLRRMITQYRAEMGILSIIGIILLIWHGVFRHRDGAHSTPIISENVENEMPVVGDSIVDVPVSKTMQQAELHKLMAEVSLTDDTIEVIENDSTVNDTIRVIPNPIIREELIAQENIPPKKSEKSDWSLSLAYSGGIEQNAISRYRIPNPELPDVEGPAGEIEVTEKTRHYMPLVIGVSVNKSIASRWSVETGLRYTYLRSDFLSKSEVMNKETVQRIHYIGVSLKLNYHILSYNGFSLYAQGGGALDIPVKGSQSIMEYSPQWGNPTSAKISIYAPAQWSVEGGVGIQYHFTPSLSIYAEPSIKYYFNPGSDIETIRQDEPIEFTVPIGLRFTM